MVPVLQTMVVVGVELLFSVWLELRWALPLDTVLDLGTILILLLTTPVVLIAPASPIVVSAKLGEVIASGVLDLAPIPLASHLAFLVATVPILVLAAFTPIARPVSTLAPTVDGVTRLLPALRLLVVTAPVIP